MEFKGTEGKWTIKETKNGHQQLSSLDWGNFCKVCNVTNVNNKYIQIARANALLISKAPELLQMIELLIDRLEENDLGNLNAVERAKQLIKQATEL